MDERSLADWSARFGMSEKTGMDAVMDVLDRPLGTSKGMASASTVKQWEDRFNSQRLTPERIQMYPAEEAGYWFRETASKDAKLLAQHEFDADESARRHARTNYGVRAAGGDIPHQDRPQPPQVDADRRFAELQKLFPGADRRIFDQHYGEAVKELKAGATLEKYVEKFRKEGAEDIAWAMRKTPFAGAAFSAVEIANIDSAFKAIKAGTANGSDYRGAAAFLVRAEEAKQQGFGRQVAEIVAQLPGFAAEFTATGGVFSGVKAATEAKLVSLLGTGLLAKGAAAGASFGAGALAQTAANPQRIAESFARRFADQYGLHKLDEQNVMVALSRPGDDFVPAMAKAFGDVAIELASERAGSAFTKEFWRTPAGEIFKKLPASERMSAVKAAVMDRWLAASPGRTPTQFSQLVARSGWNGVIPEMLEERVGDVARGLTGVEDDYGPLGDLAAGRTEEGLQQLLAEAAAFMVPGSLRAGSDALGNAAERRQQAAGRKAAEESARKKAAEDEAFNRFFNRASPAQRREYQPDQAPPAPPTQQAIELPAEQPVEDRTRVITGPAPVEQPAGDGTRVLPGPAPATPNETREWPQLPDTPQRSAESTDQPPPAPPPPPMYEPVDPRERARRDARIAAGFAANRLATIPGEAEAAQLPPDMAEAFTALHDALRFERPLSPARLRHISTLLAGEPTSEVNAEYRAVLRKALDQLPVRGRPGIPTQPEIDPMTVAGDSQKTSQADIRTPQIAQPPAVTGNVSSERSGPPAPEPGTGLINPVQSGVPGIVSGAVEVPVQPATLKDLEAKHSTDELVGQLVDAVGKSAHNYGHFADLGESLGWSRTALHAIADLARQRGLLVGKLFEGGPSSTQRDRDWAKQEPDIRGGDRSIIAVSKKLPEAAPASPGGEGAKPGAENVTPPQAGGKETDNPHVRLAKKLAALLDTPNGVDREALWKLADSVYGGTRAEGKYGPSDAYDAMELAVNLYLKGKVNPGAKVVGTGHAKKEAAKLREIVDALPTQTNRSGTKDTHQQFSTPPDYAYAAAWVANIQAGETALEPSAGTGDILVQLQNAGAKVYANEYEQRRAGLLDALAPADVFTEDAEQLANIMPGKMSRPTVIVMNPPFSQTGGRMGGKKVTATGARHVEQALRFLAPGGRLVAIVGRGMGFSDASFAEWWAKTRRTYDVRANVAVDGKVYAKYGTAFGTRLLVIDKPARAKTALAAAPEIVTGTAENVSQLIDLLKEVRNGRTISSIPDAEGDRQAERPPAQPARQAPAEGAEGGLPAAPAVQRPAAPVGAAESRPGREVEGTPAGDSGASERPGSGPAAAAGAVTGAGAESRERLQPARPDGAQGAGAGGERGAEGSGVTADRGVPEQREAEVPRPGTGDGPAVAEEKGEMSDSNFEAYRPTQARYANSKQHPTPLVESAAMASVPLPKPSATAMAAVEKTLGPLITKGLLSDAQAEAITYAVNAHEQMLPPVEGTSYRRGFMDGDGTGVGKGREISGLIMHHWKQGQKKHLWISEKSELLEDSRNYWEVLGGNPKEIFDLSRTKAGGDVKGAEGILFTTYDTLKSGERVQSEDGSGKKKLGKTRVDQIVEWLGEDFDGVIVFDESHNLGNSVETRGNRGKKKAAQKALAGVALQMRLPKARIAYFSATAATEVSNLAYADRLGLWGKGTAFASKEEFISEIGAGGLAAMETVAQSMKGMGQYIARNLSYEGVEYQMLAHKLTPNQRAMYDDMARAWQVVAGNMRTVLQKTEADGMAKGQAEGQFRGAQQRFFNAVLTAMQTPSVIEAIEKDLTAGYSAVIQLVNTNEAALQRAKSQKAMLDEEEDNGDLDTSPNQILLMFLEKSFPTQQFESYVDENGNERSRPVMDAKGNPVENAEAVAIRDDLIERLASMKKIDGALDMIIRHFGPEAVSEVTGRKLRLQRVTDKTGATSLEHVGISDSGKLNIAETSAFMGGKKRILAFSAAGGTGRSYHADLNAENQQLRRHYVLQTGWRADTVIQGFGRSHRTNQKQPPHIILVHTDVKGQKRFISTIARRLAQLGAITRGQRQAAGNDLFSEQDNMESRQARDALKQLFRDIRKGRINGLSLQAFEDQTGLTLNNSDGSEKSDDELPTMERFLNRLLSMEIDSQNVTFDAFEERWHRAIETAKQKDELDIGVEVYKADKISTAEEKVVYRHPQTGAEASYVRFNVKTKTRTRTFDEANRYKHQGFFQNAQSGRVWAVTDWNDKTLKNGDVIKQIRLLGPSVNAFQVRDATDLNDKLVAINMDEAKKLWDAELAELPEFDEYDEHLITGALLPIWDRLGNSNPKVVRLQTDTGKRYLGRIVPHNEVKATLKSLGVEAESAKIEPAAIFAAIKRGEITATTANGWQFKAARVQNEGRIELVGPDFYTMRKELESDGVFFERIGYSLRAFLPASSEGVKVMERLTENRPVIDTIRRDRSQAYRVPSGPPPSSPPDDLGPGKDTPSSKIAQEMSQVFNVPIRTGRVRTAGIYKVSPEVVRLHGKNAGDIPIMAHEVAHHVAKMTGILDGMGAGLKQELEGLDYEPQKARAEEGFAEFVRFYLTTNNAQVKAPRFARFWDQWLGEHQEEAAKFERVKSLIDDFRSSKPEERVAAQVANIDEQRKADPAGVADALINTLTDRMRPIEQFTEQAKKLGANFKPGDSPIERARALDGTASIFTQEAVEKGVFKMTGNREKIGPALKEVYDGLAPDDVPKFELWMYARHALEAHSKGVNPGIGLDDAQAIFDQWDSPEWHRRADTFTAFNNALLDMAVDAGRLSAADAQRMKEAYETYIPLMRVKDDAQAKALGSRGVIDAGALVKRRFGSGLRIVSPLQATIQRTHQFYTAAAQQQVVQGIIETADADRKHEYGTPGLGEFVERIPPGMKGVSASIREVREDLEKAGIDPDAIEDADQDALLHIFRPVWQGDRGEHIARIYVNGQPQLYKIKQDLFEATMGMAEVGIDNVFLKAIKPMADLFKLGATDLNPTFVMTNAMRDSLSYWMQRKHAKGMDAIILPAKAVGLYAASFIQRARGRNVHPLLKLYQKAGGELSRRYGADAKSVRRLADDISGGRKTPWGKAKAHTGDAYRVTREVMGALEQAFRLAEFEAALKARGVTSADIAAGRVPAHILNEAVNAAHSVTTDFRRMGRTGRQLNIVLPYLNASVQGTLNVVRNMKRGEVIIRMAQLFALGVAWALLRKDDDDYQEQPDYLRHHYLTIPWNGEPVVRIRKAEGWGTWIFSGAEALTYAIAKNRPDVIQSQVKLSALGALPLRTPVGTSILEAAFNYDTFRGRPIVDAYLEQRRPGDQAQPWNSEVMKAIGKALNVSPARLEHGLSGMTGGMLADALKTGEWIVGARETAPDLPIYRGFTFKKEPSESISQFYEQKGTVSQDYTSLRDEVKKELGSSASDAQVTLEMAKQNRELVMKHSAFEDMGKLMQSIREGQKDVLDRDQRFETEKYLIGLAREALGKPELDRYPNPLRAGVGSPNQAVRASVGTFVYRQLMEATNPVQITRNNGESLDAFQERKARRELQHQQALANLARTDLTADQMKQAIRERNRVPLWTPDRGLTPVGQRVQRVNRLLKEIKDESR